ncbi:MAG TPA: hypothetical protein VGF67_13030 [Ktedonobacteraceae bacterium]|jgi:hypothetical protein
MYLYLLTFTYAVEDWKLVDADLARIHPDGVLISTEQYDDEVLAVLASHQPVDEVCNRLAQHPAVSSCVGKHCPVYHIITSTTPEKALRTFPLREGEEWYLGGGRSVYLCVQSPLLGARQVSWIATSTEIAAWEYWFNLVSVSAGR